MRARALRALINDLLNLTAMDTGNFTIRRSRLDLRPIVESVVGGVIPAASVRTEAGRTRRVRTRGRAKC